MTVAELIDRAVTHQDAEAATRVSEFLRINYGYTYWSIVDMVRKRHPNLTASEWGALLREDG